MDGRRYESMDGRGRVASGTKTENNAGSKLSRATHDCMDAGGRATHGAVAEETKPRNSYRERNFLSYSSQFILEP